MKNWKTTLAGLAALGSVLVKLLNQLASGEGINITAEDISIIAVGGGLLGAKDHNVTGGTKTQ